MLDGPSLPAARAGRIGEIAGREAGRITASPIASPAAVTASPAPTSMT
jgi:hypothetical protein